MQAIINILLGCCGDIFVVSTVQLDCKGPSLGVEHSELGARHPVHHGNQFHKRDGFRVWLCVCPQKGCWGRSQPRMFLSFDSENNVHRFKVCCNALWVPCISHSLNTIARAALTGLDRRMVEFFEKGPSFLHAKRQAARRRRWFAFLRQGYPSRQNISARDGRFGEIVLSGGWCILICFGFSWEKNSVSLAKEIFFITAVCVFREKP